MTDGKRLRLAWALRKLAGSYSDVRAWRHYNDIVEQVCLREREGLEVSGPRNEGRSTEEPCSTCGLSCCPGAPRFKGLCNGRLVRTQSRGWRPDDWWV